MQAVIGDKFRWGTNAGRELPKQDNRIGRVRYVLSGVIRLIEYDSVAWACRPLDRFDR